MYNAHCSTLCQYNTCTFYILQSYNVLGRYFIPSFHIPLSPRSTFLHLLIPHSFTSSFHIHSFPHSTFLHSLIHPFHIPSFSCSRMQWFCCNCHSPYNREVIETSLIQSIQKKSVAFSLQDLVCVKCHGVSCINWAVCSPHQLVIFMRSSCDYCVIIM